MQTTKKALNPALEHPEMLQHSDVLLLCEESLQEMMPQDKFLPQDCRVALKKKKLMDG